MKKARCIKKQTCESDNRNLSNCEESVSMCSTNVVCFVFYLLLNKHCLFCVLFAAQQTLSVLCFICCSTNIVCFVFY